MDLEWSSSAIFKTQVKQQGEDFNMTSAKKGEEGKERITRKNKFLH